MMCFYFFILHKYWTYMQYICTIYAVMKKMCLPVYHHNGFVATHALGRNCTWCSQLQELPQNHCDDNREVILFSWLHIYYPHLAFVGLEHFMWGGSLMTSSYICTLYIIYLYCLDKNYNIFQSYYDLFQVHWLVQT